MIKVAPPLSDVDIRLLRVFRAIADCNGFTQAGVELGLSRSTVSTHMAALETRLGFRLCHRGRGGFALTEKGQQTLEAVVRLLTSLEEFRSDIGMIGGRVTGKLNLGLLDNIVSDPNRYVSRALDRLAEEAPDVHVQIQTESPNEISRGLLDGRLHLGISPGLNATSGLKFFPFYRERLSLYCGSKHALFAIPDEDISTDTIRQLPYVRRGYHTDLPEKADLRGPAAATSYGMEGLLQFLLTGRFIGFLPDHYTVYWLAAGALRRLKPKEFGYSLDFSILVPRAASMKAPVKLFLDHLIALRDSEAGPE